MAGCTGRRTGQAPASFQAARQPRSSRGAWPDPSPAGDIRRFGLPGPVL